MPAARCRLRILAAGRRLRILTAAGMLLAGLVFDATGLWAQMPDSSAWRYGHGQLMSHRATNVFLSEAAGYFMSSPDDLSLYKNSVIADAAAGTLAIYHNMRQPAGVDEPIRNFLSIGAQADIANAYSATHGPHPYNNRFGLLVKETWVGKASVSASLVQQQTMDALRAGILHALQQEIRRKRAEFESSLAGWDSVRDVPGQDLSVAKNAARAKFETDLVAEYTFKYAHEQAETLARTFNYGVMAFNWTSVSIYVPLVTENFQSTPTLADAPVHRHAYPLYLHLRHSRLWESSHFGRLFLTVAGDVALNNSRDAFGWNSDLYVGEYEHFVTPSFKLQAVYLPTDSHIGVSGSLQQYFGRWDVLNAVVGVPIVLINKQAEPAINFEFQVRFFDISNRLVHVDGMPGRTSIGMTMGVPFSKIAF